MSNLNKVAAFAPSACGSACGAGDPRPEEKPASACGAGDPKPEEKPASACGSACGAGDPKPE